MNGSFSGNSVEIQLLGQSKESYHFSDTAPTAPNDTNRFRIRVDITDSESGEVGMLEFGVLGYLSTVLPAELRGEAGLSEEQEAASAVVIGRYRYELSVRGGSTDSNTWLYGHVTATEVVPEPATLALAGVGGLALLGLRRRASKMA